MKKTKEKSFSETLKGNIFLMLILSSVVGAITALYIEHVFSFVYIVEGINNNNFIPLIIAIALGSVFCVIVLYPIYFFLAGADIVSKYAYPFGHPVRLLSMIISRIVKNVLNRLPKHMIGSEIKIVNPIDSMSDFRKNHIKSLIIFVIFQHVLTNLYKIDFRITFYLTLVNLLILLEIVANKKIIFDES